MTVGALVNSPDLIAARLERLPVGRWHGKVRILLGAATLFDAYDALVIAFVLPSIVGLWHLSPGEIGSLISIGFVGQLVGALAFGWFGERYGRLAGLNWTIGILAVFGIACALSWSYSSLLVFRFLQGLGVGGEIPIAATYINEIAKAERRGQFVLIYQCVFPLGTLTAAIISTWVIPHLGWQWMFVVGALPALLILPMRRTLPESPRWLARNGRLDEADRVVSEIERQIVSQGRAVLPPVPDSFPSEAAARGKWTDLFRGMYRWRTISVCTIWFCSGSVTYGVQTWLPTMVRQKFKLPVAVTLQYSTLGYVMLVLVCIGTAFFIDRVGRRATFLTSFIGALGFLFVLTMLVDGGSAITLMSLAFLAMSSASISQLAIWVYAPEIFPTRMRSLGAGTACSSARLAAILMPSLVGWVLSYWQDLSAVFLMFTVIAAVGLVTVIVFVFETRGKPLEEISP